MPKSLENACDELRGSHKELQTLLEQLNMVALDIKRYVDNLTTQEEASLREFKKQYQSLTNELEYSNIKNSNDISRLTGDARSIYMDTAPLAHQERLDLLSKTKDIEHDVPRVSIEIEKKRKSATELLGKFQDLKKQLEKVFPEETRQINAKHEKEVAQKTKPNTDELLRQIEAATAAPSKEKMKELINKNKQLSEIKDLNELEKRFTEFKKNLQLMGLELNDSKITIIPLRIKDLDEIFTWCKSVRPHERDAEFNIAFEKLYKDRQDLDVTLNDGLHQLQECYKSFQRRKVEIQVEQQNSKIIEGIGKNLSPSKQKEEYLKAVQDWIRTASLEQKKAMADFLFSQKEHILNRETGFNKGFTGLFKPVYSTKTTTMAKVQGLLSQGQEWESFKFAKDKKNLERSSAKEAYEKARARQPKM